MFLINSAISHSLFWVILYPNIIILLEQTKSFLNNNKNRLKGAVSYHFDDLL